MSLERSITEFVAAVEPHGVSVFPIAGNATWRRLRLISHTPLVPEPQIAPSYAYEFLLRESQEDTARMVLVSSHLELIQHLLGVVSAGDEIRRPRIDVRALVQKLVDAPERYRLAAVFARVDGFGQALRAISFYGAVIGGASLFTDALPAIDPHRVFLRDARTGVEVLSVASRGELSFTFNDNLHALSGVDAALGFLKRWIHW
jgi:hypothetical protein